MKWKHKNGFGDGTLYVEQVGDRFYAVSQNGDVALLDNEFVSSTIVIGQAIASGDYIPYTADQRIKHYPTTEELWREIGQMFLARGEKREMCKDVVGKTKCGLCHAVDWLSYDNFPDQYHRMNTQIDNWKARHGQQRSYINGDEGDDKLLRAEIAFELADEAR